VGPAGDGLAPICGRKSCHISLAEPLDKGADPLAGLKFEAGSPGGVPKEAFRALHPLGSGTFTKVETGHTDTFDLRPDEGRRRYLRDKIKAGGTLLIVAVPEDEEVEATYYGAGVEEPSSSRRTYRGGCWHNPGTQCLATARGRGDRSTRGSGLGFRVALVPTGS
jgi:hypothetical protein